jgi:hypothetical protein
VYIISNITKTLLTDVIKRHVENKDFENARSYIRSWGPQIKNFDIQKELKKIDEIKNKVNKKVKPEKEDKRI